MRLLNRGYLDKENNWKEAEGKAYHVESAERGFLKVSFFGPFSGSYIIIDLDQDNYQYALVCGSFDDQRQLLLYPMSTILT